MLIFSDYFQIKCRDIQMVFLMESAFEIAVNAGISAYDASSDDNI